MEIKTKTQIKAYDNIVNCVNYIVGGRREKEYHDFTELRETVYHEVLNTVYVDGSCTKADPVYTRQIRF